ncbi:hypothetical protein SUDANB25_01973 [Streptomyces sp. SudanB25_2051]
MAPPGGFPYGLRVGPGAENRRVALRDPAVTRVVCLVFRPLFGA